MSAGKVPRHSLEAEAAVLSASLLKEDAARTAVALLHPRHFFSDANALAFSAIAYLLEQGAPVDLVSVASVLQTREQLARVGGTAYLAEIVDKTPAVAHVEHHCRIVLDTWRLRQLVAECQAIAAEGYGDTGPIEEFLSDAERRVAQFATATHTSRARLIGEIASEVYAGLSQPEEAGVTDRGVTSGNPVERYVRKAPGTLQIVAARPGMGKSSYANQDAIDATLTPQPGGERIAALIHSLEMPERENAARAIANRGGVDVARVLTRKVTAADWPRVVAALSDLHAAPVWIDDTPGITLDRLRASVRTVKRLAKEKGFILRIVVVDYLQLMRGHGGTREQEIEAISGGLKILAKEEDLHVIALSQLNREVEKRSPPRPQLADIRSSGAIEQDADSIVFLYRPEVYAEQANVPVPPEERGLCEAIVGKNRNGTTGIVRLRFFRACTRFEPLEPEYPEQDEEGPWEQSA